MPLSVLQTILFTVNEAVLDRVSHHDPVFQSDHATSTTATISASTSHHDHTPQLNRPTTAHSHQGDEVGVGEEDDCRPFTSANIPNLSNYAESATSTSGSKASNFGSIVEVVLADNWGDPSHIGLTSIALLEVDSRQPMALRPDQLTISLPLLEGDQGGVEGCGSNEVAKLIDGNDITTDEAHMWACPTPHPQHCPSLIFELDTPTSLRGLRVWNYNAAMEDSYKGVCVYTK